MKSVYFIVYFLIGLTLHGSHLRICLQDALRKKLVETKIVSLGGHQGYCIQMTLKNLSKDSLIVLVEPGRRLNSVDDKEQDILIVKEEIIALKSRESKGIKVKGYCCQASNRSPSKGSKYAPCGMADSSLVRLARLINFKQFGSGAEQEAIWAISDGHSSAYISSEDDSVTQALRERVALLKGEELPWYRIISKRYSNPGGAINFVNLRLQGLLAYANEKENYATLSVKNEHGLLVCQVKSEWLKISTGEIYKLDLPIKGLAKGKYTIELTTPDKELARRMFEI